MNRQFATVALAAVAVTLTLTGCAPEPATDPGDAAGKLKAWTVLLPDGRSVACVSSTDSRSGIDCDWENAQ
ncbi:hypothetical protein [Oerskovia paurometabola]|uniref:hypothetical protein n=1 Tax=Oerskovia paurometabola TaxID=162170 RepID=UPI00343DC9F8